MDAKFTTKSQEALSAANMNAQTAGNPSIEPAHILKALMDQREGVAVQREPAWGAPAAGCYRRGFGGAGATTKPV